MSKLSNFHANSTKRFDVAILYDGVAPNIVNDTVSVVFKTKKGGEVVISKDADVDSLGLTGIAKFTLTPTDTDVAHGKYYYEIIWTLDTTEVFVIDEGTISILERV